MKIFKTKTLDKLNEEINNSYKNSFGENTDTSANSPLGNIKAPVVIVLNYVHTLIDYIAMQINPNTAQKIHLDTVCSLNNIYRKKDSKGEGHLTLIGLVGTIVPKGTKFSTNDNIIFISKKDELLTSSQKTIEIESLKYSIPSVAAHTITSIVNPVDGLNTVTNETASIKGEVAETDAQFRLRRRKSIAINSNSVNESIRSALLATAGITKAFIFESGDGKTLPFQTSKAAYIYAVVDGGSSKDIAKALGKTKTVGIPTIGTQSDTWIDSSGKTVTYHFDRPVKVEITFNIELQITDNEKWPLNGLPEAKNFLLDYLINQIDVGQNIYYSNLFTPLNKVEGHSIRKLGIIKAGAEEVTSDIQMAINEIGDYDLDRINIILV